VRVGAFFSADKTTTFTVWAPFRKTVELKIVAPQSKIVPMEKDDRGYWHAEVHGLSEETQYIYRLDGQRERPDPASHFQPSGVHEPSQIVNHGLFNWTDENWKLFPLEEMIIYELHVGTFTREGTFDAILPRLSELNDLGINTIELMPVAQFPGIRNWGYDGVSLFAVQNSYGGPDRLKKLVNACHEKGIAVVLDVVYNHLGPEGNYLWDYGPYFTDKYKTPWGEAVNFDDAYSNEVRNFYIENALYWIKYYHIDALRLDAVHGISDLSAKPFLQELADSVGQFSSGEKWNVYLIAESDLNDTRIIRKKEIGGYGLDAQWCDDFHHCIHTLLTGEQDGYYCDFGSMADLVKSLREGFVYSGEYSAFRKRNHGNSSKDIPAYQFVVFSQNHDQTGNRALGERLSQLVTFEALKLVAGTVLLSPYIPLIFMGEEYGEDTPFLYFVSHSDPALVEAVRKGRREEFRTFTWEKEPPDPQDDDTFRASKLQWEKRESVKHRILLDFYTHLIGLRKKIPPLMHLNKENLEVYAFEKEKVLCMERWEKKDRVFCILNFNTDDVKLRLPLPEGKWKKIVDSSDVNWKGPGTLLPLETERISDMKLRRQSFAVFRGNP
jgi:maltooligosyltrehalose trehalohydrolase